MPEKPEILSIKARKILDSRGSWTVEVDLQTSQGVFRDSAPSGASTGKYEAPIVSPEAAVKNINEIIAAELKGKEFADQEGIDNFLNPERFGSNATTPLSMAVCRAGAAVQKLPLYKYIAQLYLEKNNTTISTAVKKVVSLPKPCFNMINGGAHASNQLDFQEFMIVPACNASRSDAGRCDTEKASAIYQELRKKLGKNVGDEGGFAPDLKSAEEALNLLSQYGVNIIIDVAASQFFKNGNYKLGNRAISGEELLDYYLSLIRKYPILGFEDPFDEDDFESWQAIMSKVKAQISNVSIIGDDLLVTNPERIKMAKEKNLCNGLLLKINQIGNVTKALEAARLAKSHGWKIMVSHRSGETNDDFIADFAVGIGADFIKTGAPARGERVAKYNRLLKIKEEII